MKNKQSGQALITLIFAMALAITILSGATITAVTLGKTARLTENAQTAYYTAESGIEYGLLKLIRNPLGCVGPADALAINASNVIVSYSLSGSVCTILATATTDTISKKIQVQATIANSKVIYSGWKELP